MYGDEQERERSEMYNKQWENGSFFGILFVAEEMKAVIHKQFIMMFKLILMKLEVSGTWNYLQVSSRCEAWNF